MAGRSRSPRRSRNPMESIDKAFDQHYGVRDGKFYLWVDRQIRPTIGASAKRGIGRDRTAVGDAVFTAMLQTLVSAIDKLIPQHRGDVYITFSTGSWQRSREFHIKAHLTTEAFLSLLDQLCRLHSLGRNPLADLQSKQELEKRQRKDHHGGQLLALVRNENRTDLKREKGFHIATVADLDYPLLCLYATSADGETTTAIPASQLPAALTILETFVAEDWEQKGFSIAMVPAAATAGSEGVLCYHVVANVEEGEFASRVGKDVGRVQRSWGWSEPERRYH